MGGAIFNAAGTVVLMNSTITGNSATGGNSGQFYTSNVGLGLGGGLFNLNGSVKVISSTLSGNAADPGANGAYYRTRYTSYGSYEQLVGKPSDQRGRNLFNLGAAQIPNIPNTPAAVTITNSILTQAAGDPADFPGEDFTSKTIGAGKATATGNNNLIDTQSGFGGSFAGGDPELGPLQNNGGLTPTLAPQPGSPAINAGDAQAPAFDQRGMARAGKADVGAVEFAAWKLVVTGRTDGATNANDSSLSLREAISLANGALAFAALSATERALVTPIEGLTNTISFASFLNNSTLELSIAGDQSVGPSAFLINRPVSIVGPSDGITLEVAAGKTMRQFVVTSSGNLTLQNVTLSGGTAQGLPGGAASAGGAGGGSAGLGGAIFNQGTLTILNSNLNNNTAQGGAGGGFGGNGNGGAGGAGLSAAGSAASSNFGGAGGGPNGGNGGFPTFGFFFSNNGASGGFGGGGGGMTPVAGQPLLNGSGGRGGFGAGGGGGALLVPGGAGGFGGGGGGFAGTAGFAAGAGGAFPIVSGGGGGAGLGGAIFNEAGTVVITNSTLANNAAIGGAGGVGGAGPQSRGSDGQGLGGGLFNHNGVFTITGSTLSANVANQGGNAAFNLGDSSFATTSSTAAFAGFTNTTVAAGDFVSTNNGGGTNVLFAPLVNKVANDAAAQALYRAINALAPQSPPVTIQIELAAGRYTDIRLQPRAGVTVIIKGAGIDTTIVGNSPAVTVTGGDVEIDNVMLVTDTDSPTALVTSGTLKLRNDEIQQTLDFDDPGIVAADGGFVDLGTEGDPGNDQFDGQGSYLWVADPTEYTSFGDTFDGNGTTATGSGPTSTFGTSSDVEIVVGQNVQLTATVISRFGGTPTGDVDFFDVSSNVDLGTAHLSLVQDVAAATLTTSQLGVGPHEIRVTYGGDNAYLASESTIEMLVVAANTPPVAQDDHVELTNLGAGIDFQPLANDTDADGDHLQIVSIGPSDAGQLIDRGDGRYTFVPSSISFTHTTLEYTAHDGAGGEATATISIDRHLSGGQGNAQAYVKALYEQLLGRDADAAGMAYWVDLLSSGVTRQQVGAGLLNSDEGRLQQINDLYFTYLGRSGEDAATEAYLHFLDQGGTLQDLRTIFLTSAEFMAHTGGSAEEYVEGLYQTLLNRSGTGDDGAASFVSFIEKGGDIATVVRAILNSSEGSQSLANRWYDLFLERKADADGLAYWTNQLQQSGGAEEQAIVGFLASDEFFNRS
jgi:hypothetical protein